jgi:lipopolysaccharide biosynthesis protein
MFWVKTEAIRPLLDITWNYEMFPEETSQMDGALQHGLERLFGDLARARGYAQASFVTNENTFRILKDIPVTTQ